VELSRIAEESARGSFSLMAGTATSTIIGGVASIVIARLLGPAMYGLYSLAFVLPALLLSVTNLGVDSALKRFAASLRSQQKFTGLASMMRSGLLLRLAASSAAFLLMLAFSGQLAASVLQRQDMEQLVAVASLMIIFQGLSDLSYSTLVGLDRADQSALVRSLPDAVRAVLSPALIVVGLGVVGAVVGQVSGWVLAGLVGVWFLLAQRRALRKMPSERESKNGPRTDIRTIMSYGLPLYVGGLLVTVLDQYQTIVLAFFTSDAEIGIFTVALNFTMLIEIVAAPVATALLPAFSKLDLETKKEALQKVFQQSICYTTLIIFPVAIFVITLSGELILAVYGAAYSDASTYLTLYTSVFLLTGLGYLVIGNFLSGIGRTKETLKIALLQLIIFIPSAPVMAWLFRVPGLVVAFVISAFVATSFGMWLAIRAYGMHVAFGRSVAALAAALVSALPVLLFLQNSPLPALANVCISAPMYLGAYLTLAPVFRAVRRTDVQFLDQILGQVRFLGAASHLIFAYETRLLSVLEHD